MSFSPEIFSNKSYDVHADLIREMGRQRIADGYRKIVFTNGCFDILHPGHLKVLAFCKYHAGPYGAVVVGLNDDDSVRRLKGDERPIFDERSRSLMLLSTRYVDHVVTFEEDTPRELIESLKPDIIVKGGDYSMDVVVGRHVAPVVISPLDEDWSTSKVISKIKGEACETFSSRVI